MARREEGLDGAEADEVGLDGVGLDWVGVVGRDNLAGNLGSGGSGGEGLRDVTAGSETTMLGELRCRAARPSPSTLGGTVSEGVVGVDMVLFTVMMLARRPSPLGRRISGDGGDGERLSEPHARMLGKFDTADSRF